MKKVIRIQVKDCRGKYLICTTFFNVTIKKFQILIIKLEKSLSYETGCDVNNKIYMIIKTALRGQVRKETKLNVIK
jgi:hypothetical protein